jgi:hypothetical protein
MALRDPSIHPSREAFSIHPWMALRDLSIHLSRHPSMDAIIQGRKPWQK